MTKPSRSSAARKRRLGGGEVAGLERAHPALVLEEGEDGLAAGGRFRPVERHQFLADPRRVVPLVLLLVDLLEVEQGIGIGRIEPPDFLERLDRPVDEPAALEVEPEAEHHVGVLEPGELLTLQQRLVHLDRPRHLTALAVDVAEDQVDLERVGVDPGRLAELLDRQVDLVGDQEVQAEHVVVRVAGLAAVDPAAVAQLVALPRLADGHASEQGEQRRDEGEVAVEHGGLRPVRSSRARAGGRRRPDGRHRRPPPR